MSIFGKRKIVLGKWIFGFLDFGSLESFGFLDCKISRILKNMVWQSLKSFGNIGHCLFCYSLIFIISQVE